jgi:serine/threonine protein kinase
VKDDGKACLADFGLMSIALDPETTDITSSTGGAAKGTYRWMSPELFYPKEFGLPKFQLTKESDCYAFGMVVYEVGPRCGVNYLSRSSSHSFAVGLIG